MHKYLQDFLVCPNCKKELAWNILREDSIHVTDAAVSCLACGKNYFVRDGIANFLIDFNDVKDDWKEGSKFLESYFAEFPHLKEKLLTAPLESLNGADLYARAEVLKTCGELSEAEKISDYAAKKIWNKDYLKSEDAQISFIIGRLADESGFAVDVASGMGRLIDKFLEKTRMDLVSTDISYSVLVKSQQKRRNSSQFKRISYIAFDIRAVPFKDKSIRNMTTILGLQNIVAHHEQIAKELLRVCGGTFYADCQFFMEDDETHKSALEKLGMEEFFFKDMLVSRFKQCGWESRVENSVVFSVSPTPTGEIVSGYGIDAFPIEETHCESCVAVLTN